MAIETPTSAVRASGTENLPMPSRNPIPLSASQEAQVRDVYYARVRRHCAAEVKGEEELQFSIFNGVERGTIPCPTLHAKTPRPIFKEFNLLTCALAIIVAFAECANGRTFSVPFACRETHRAMNACMKLYATPAEEDAAREEWFAARMERARERERKAKRALEQENFLREWWGLPEKDREERRKAEEKLKLKERIGGFAAKDRKRFDETPAGEGKR